jgi:hypothetical protein
MVLSVNSEHWHAVDGYIVPVPEEREQVLEVRPPLALVAVVLRKQRVLGLARPSVCVCVCVCTVYIYILYIYVVVAVMVMVVVVVVVVVVVEVVIEISNKAVLRNHC